MSNKLFRKKSVERVSSPEQLNDYIHVSNPSAWVVLAAFAILLIGVCVWGIFGTLDTTLSVVAVKENDGVVCYVREADNEKIKVGMSVEIGDEKFLISDIAKTPVPVDARISDYAKHVGALTDGEWIYYVYLDGSSEPEENVSSAKIIIERINPFYFVTN